MKRTTLNLAAAAAIILGMIGVSVALQEKEIIFPEIAALCTGVFLTPKLLWKDTGAGKFLGLMTASALVGIALAALIPWVYLRVVLGCAFTLVCLTVFRSGLFPMLSACILPALLSVTTWIYPVSVLGCSLAIVLVKQALGGFQAVATDTDYRSRAVLLPRLTGCLLVLLYALVPCQLGIPPLIAPPLFVLFLELYTEDGKLRRKEWKVCLLAVLSCTLGAGVTLLTGGPLTAGVLITAGLLALLRLFGVYLPPVAALCYLPLILPGEKLLTYPVFTGVTLLVMTVFLRWKRSRCGK